MRGDGSASYLGMCTK